ncbi:DUF4238 domain-containing protein [Maribacter sp. X9]|uniref:DUF4238 domain-containing protein n=1 Tax=Maribacter sp. X9 TaxID=3402159 RepID=UPI003AF344BC
MNKDTHIKQHYIPQCYLRNFSPNGKFINIYDKIVSKSFSNSLDSIADFDYFYEIPKKYLSEKFNIPYGTKYFEKAFFAEHIEKIYAQILDKIVHKANCWIKTKERIEILTKNEKEELAQLIAIQHLRMPNVKDDNSNTFEKAMLESFDIIKSGIININPVIDNKEIIIEYDKDYDTVLHSNLYANEKLVSDFATQVLNKDWFFYISENTDFYTSDNPIIIKPHIQNERNYYDGLGMKGVEIIFPISKSIILIMRDSNYFPEKQGKENTFELINLKQMREYNCYRYIWANRQVYSYSNDFNIIKGLKMVNGGKEIIMKRPKTLVNGK